MVPASAEGQGPLPTTHLPKVKPLRADLLPGRGAHSLPTLPAPGEGTGACQLMRPPTRQGQRGPPDGQIPGWTAAGKGAGEGGQQRALEPRACRGRGGSAGPCCGPLGSRERGQRCPTHCPLWGQPPTWAGCTLCGYGGARGPQRSRQGSQRPHSFIHKRLGFQRLSWSVPAGSAPDGRTVRRCTC